MPITEFDIEQRRLRAAHSLPPQCADDFQRLSRSLLHGPPFQWLLVDAPHEALRKQVMAALDGVLHAAGLRTNSLPLSQKIDDVGELERRLINNAAQAQVVHVIGRPGWFTAPRWDAFNARRERVAQQARARLVFWLDEAAIELASRGAPDLWAWRAGVYAFKPLAQEQVLSASEARLAHASRPQDVDARSLGQRLARIAAIRGWLKAHPDAPDEMLIGPIDELGQLLHDIGDVDEAMALWRGVDLPLHRRRGDERAVAKTQSQIADVLQARGQLDEALRIWLQDVLPVYERLGDLRERAVTQVYIADVLLVRGKLDEALHIWRDEVLPVFEKLGDARSVAGTQRRIADVLQARGQVDAAMRIRREKELPVYEKLGDVHARAITQGRIADVLQERGQLEEALRIRREEQLPVYEKLGDVRARAVTQSQIADLMRARGQFDEALRMLRDEVLPVQAKLGFVRDRAITQGQIADVLLEQGQFDEALRIRREEELPLYEKLGDVLARAITQWKIARQLLDKSPPQRDLALPLLVQAHAALAGMGLPEADELLKKAQQFGLVLPDAERISADGSEPVFEAQGQG